MKRLFILLVCFALIFSGCSTNQGLTQQKTESGNTISGIWLTYSEINNMFSSQIGFKAEVEAVTKNCKEIGIDLIFVHIRSFCDSLYESEYFPLIKNSQNIDFDPFEYMLTVFHNAGIKVHAWINPYRVQTASEDINLLSPSSPAYKWLTDTSTENDTNVCMFDGIYLNPASEEVRKLVIDGVKEAVSRYDIDGIHFDDYFYPTAEASFDAESYGNYTSKTVFPLSLEEWRRTNVNLLISGTYTAIKTLKPEVIFSISPTADIEKNINLLYADIEHWLKNGYVDWIIPQLYFGFEYPDENFRFENILKKWQNLTSPYSVQLLIGLANYKIGTTEPYDSAEWNSKHDIIARQADICYKQEDIFGYVLFSLSSVFSDEELNIKQRQNLLKVKEKQE